jgi:hypothetical protein
MKTYSIGLVKIPKEVTGLQEAVIDDETGEAAFVVSENREYATRLIEFMNRMERIKKE